MNREILFRGARLCDGKIVTGALVMVKENDESEKYVPNIVISYGPDTFDWFEVKSETVGQFTGLTDKNGTKIFEGDVLKFVGGTCDFFVKSAHGHRHEKGTNFTVKWFPSGYTLYESKTKNPLYPNCWSNIGNYDFWNNSRSFEVIGNIYDNKELLK